MQATTTISKTAARVLQLVKDRGVTRGSEVLNRLASERQEDVLEAVRELVSTDLVIVKGDCYELERFAEAYLTVRPSAAAYADYAIRSASR